MSLRDLCRRRLLDPLNGLMRNGLAPKALAWALAVGMLVGCMPLLWGTSLLCLGAALLLRLNPLAAQVGNFAAWPLQILFAYPYLQLGTACLGPVDLASGNWLQTLLAANGVALGGWALSAPLLLPASYAVSRLLVASVGRLVPGFVAGEEGDAEGKSTVQV